MGCIWARNFSTFLQMSLLDISEIVSDDSDSEVRKFLDFSEIVPNDRHSEVGV